MKEKSTADDARPLPTMSEGFRDIGHFLFEFSQLEFTIRAMLSGRLKLAPEYFDIVTSTYDFAALCNVTREIACKQDPASTKSIEETFKKCLALNTERVRVAHGLWTHGMDGPMARYVSRSSLQPQYYFEKAGELRALANRAQQLMQEVMGFKPTKKIGANEKT